MKKISVKKAINSKNDPTFKILITEISNNQVDTVDNNGLPVVKTVFTDNKNFEDVFSNIIHNYGDALESFDINDFEKEYLDSYSSLFVITKY